MDLGIPRNPRFLILFHSFLPSFSNSNFHGHVLVRPPATANGFGDRYLLLQYSARDSRLRPHSLLPLAFVLLLSFVPTLHADPRYYHPSLTLTIASIAFFFLSRTHLSFGVFIYSPPSLPPWLRVRPLTPSASGYDGHCVPNLISDLDLKFRTLTMISIRSPATPKEIGD